MKYYKWLDGGGPVCVKSRHSILTADQVSLWWGDALIEVEAYGVEMADGENYTCRSWREAKRFKWGREDTQAFNKACTGKLWKDNPCRYFEVDGKEFASVSGDGPSLAWQRRWIEERIGEKLGEEPASCS